MTDVYKKVCQHCLTGSEVKKTETDALFGDDSDLDSEEVDPAPVVTKAPKPRMTSPALGDTAPPVIPKAPKALLSPPTIPTPQRLHQTPVVAALPVAPNEANFVATTANIRDTFIEVYKFYGPVSQQVDGQCLFTVGRLGVLVVEFHNSPHSCPEHIEFQFASVMMSDDKEHEATRSIIYQAFEVVTNAVFVAYPMMVNRYSEFVELVYTVNMYLLPVLNTFLIL